MAAINEVKPLGFSDKAYPEVFTVNPPPAGAKKEGQLSEALIKQYFEEGYIVLDKFFKEEELDPCREAIAVRVEELAQRLYKAGKISSLFKEYGLFQRLTQIEGEFPGATILLIKNDHFPKAFQDLWSNERLLNVVEQLIGPEIGGHPVWNIRVKIPRNEATTVPWHQDVGYLDHDSYSVLQPTAWIPFLDANEKNGCMQVTERGHRTGKVATHQCCHGGTWYVMLEEDEMEKTLGVNMKNDVKTVPVPYGGMLLINNLIPHRSLSNLSNDIRWSVDLRWQNPDVPNGFYGLKPCLRMRSAKDPNMRIDWDSWNTIKRHEQQKKSCEDTLQTMELDEFDTYVTGPWMKRWEIVHVNRHTTKLAADDKAP